MEKQQSSNLLYQGPIFSFCQDQVLLDDGRVVQRDVIHHHGGAGILVLHEEQILLVSQYRYAAQRQLWEIPAGKLEKGEDPFTCVIRELNEEAGYECESVTKLCAFFSTPGFCEEIIHLYIGINAKPVTMRKAMDDDEQITTKWFPLTTAYRMIQSGEIIDAKTIIAIQQAMLMKQS